MIANAHGPKGVASELQERLGDAEVLVAQNLSPNSVQKGLDIVAWGDPLQVSCYFDFVRIRKRLSVHLVRVGEGKGLEKNEARGNLVGR